jgi:hypothetical protein
VSVAKLGAGIEESAPDTRAEAIEAAIEARLTTFDCHRDDLLDLLQGVCEHRPKTKSFDPDESWRHLRSMADGYLRHEARVEQERMGVSAVDRGELLLELENALNEARCKLDEATHHDIRGVLFVEWCEAHGNPDFTDPIIDLVNREFDKLVAGVVASLADLATAASHAAEYARRERGRPPGTGVLQHDFVIGLESTYRKITGKPGRVGPGPFAQFVEKFLEAVGRKSKKETVIRTIKAVKKREQKDPATSRWGREDPRMSRWRRASLAHLGKISPNFP